MIKNLMEPKII